MRNVPDTRYLDPRLPDRFWERTTPCPMTGCWLWLSPSDGYGHFVVRSRGPRLFVWRGRQRTIVVDRADTRPAHIVAFEALVGDYDRSLELDHLCCVRSCVNPLHLEPVTPAVNSQRHAAAESFRRGERSWWSHPWFGPGIGEQRDQGE